METSKRKKVALIAFILLFSVIVLSVFLLITFRGVNITTAIDEIRYIRLDTQRQTLTYSIYKEASDFQVELDLLFAQTEYTSRATEASKLQVRGYEIADELEIIIEDYDNKMLELDVNKKLEDSAKEYYKLDSYIFAQINSSLQYLNSDLSITQYLMSKKAVIDCYGNITASKDFDANIALYNSCYAKNSALEIPSPENFPQTVEYQNYLGSWLQKNIELYQALKQNKADEADQINRTTQAMIAELERRNQLSNEELSAYLANEYYQLLK